MIPFVKTQAIGNDFVLVERSDVPQEDLAALAPRMCDRHTGIGADGLLVIAPGDLQMFNPDGTEDFCGNGLRCAAVHMHQLGWLAAEDRLMHHGREVRVSITGARRARVELGAGSFVPSEVPILRSRELFEEPFPLGNDAPVLSAVSTGSTHVVWFVPEMPALPWCVAQGASLEAHPDFPNRTSTMFAVEESPRRLAIQPFERGAGPTLGCGTGSAAAAIVHARRTGLTGDFEIVNPGGTVLVHLDRWDAPVSLESDVTEVFRGDYSPER